MISFGGWRVSKSCEISGLLVVDKAAFSRTSSATPSRSHRIIGVGGLAGTDRPTALLLCAAAPQQPRVGCVLRIDRPGRPAPASLRPICNKWARYPSASANLVRTTALNMQSEGIHSLKCQGAYYALYSLRFFHSGKAVTSREPAEISLPVKLPALRRGLRNDAEQTG